MIKIMKTVFKVFKKAIEQLDKHCINACFNLTLSFNEAR
jgi:hypothetical protein